MIQLIKPSLTRNLPIFTTTVTRTLFSGWFRAFQTQKLIYPPKPSEFTTNNRIFENWIQHEQEIHNYTLFKQPTILNFTYADQRCNRISQSLFDILSQKDKFPNGDQQINLVNILSDGAGGQELMINYGIYQIPTLLLLKKQMVQDRYLPDADNFKEQDLVEWIKSIKS